MAETGPDQPSGNQPSNKSEYSESVTFDRVISFLTLLVLSATMVGVFWYACEARKGNKYTQRLASQSLLANLQERTRFEAETRPVIAVEVCPDKFQTNPAVMFPVKIHDFSKTPAYGEIFWAIDWVIQMRGASDRSSWGSSGEIDRVLWPDPMPYELHLKLTNPYDDQPRVAQYTSAIEQINKGQGFVTIKVEARYGRSRNQATAEQYDSRICMYYPLSRAASDVVALGDPMPCPPPDDINKAH
jgi:hypothetical protein